jgi:hypothetical protein
MGVDDVGLELIDRRCDQPWGWHGHREVGPVEVLQCWYAQDAYFSFHWRLELRRDRKHVMSQAAKFFGE